eukprot:ANDGO_00861.mRNA.1 hypothetical protein SAMD00019534_046520
MLNVQGLGVLPVLVSLGFVVLMLFFIIPVRLHFRNRRIRRLPRKNMPIRRKDLPTKQADAIKEELANSVHLCSTFAPSKEASQHEGWGRYDTEFENVHFKKSISLSHIILERAAAHKDPSLKMKSNQTVRQYLLMLADECPHMSRNSVMTVIELYEKARYGQDELREDEYRLFMEHSRRVLQAFD